MPDATHMGVMATWQQVLALKRWNSRERSKGDNEEIS